MKDIQTNYLILKGIAGCDEDGIYNRMGSLLKEYFGIYKSDVTVLIPSSYTPTNKLLNLVASCNESATIIDDIFRKVTVEVVWDETVEFGSLFRKTFKTERKFNEALYRLEDDMKGMGEYFKLHLIRNPEISNCVSGVIKTNNPKAWKFIEAINGKDILIVDDGISTLCNTMARQPYSVIKENESKKTIIYLHGYGSSGMSNTVSYLRKLLPDCEVLAPDIPVDPKEALPFLKVFCERFRPDLIIGTSMGGMYAMQMLDYHRFCVNPALRMSELTDVLKVGTFDYFQPTVSGETSFTITEEIIQHFKEMEQHLFDGLTDESRLKCWGFFGDEDNIVDYKEEFQQHYGRRIIKFHGGHRMNNTVLREVIVPHAKTYIDERQADENSIKNTIEELKTYYEPKSVTVLSLPSEKQNE